MPQDKWYAAPLGGSEVKPAAEMATGATERLEYTNVADESTSVTLAGSETTRRTWWEWFLSFLVSESLVAHHVGIGDSYIFDQVVLFLFGCLFYGMCFRATAATRWAMPAVYFILCFAHNGFFVDGNNMDMWWWLFIIAFILVVTSVFAYQNRFWSKPVS